MKISKLFSSMWTGQMKFLQPRILYQMKIQLHITKQSAHRKSTNAISRTEKNRVIDNIQ